MDQKNLEINLKKYFQNQGFDLNVHQNLFESDALDSLGLFELISYMSSELNIVIAQEKMTVENFSSIEMIVKKFSN